MSTTKTTPKSKSTAAKGEKFSGFSADEKAAMKNRAAELKAEARAGKDKEAGEKAALAAIADLKEPDRTLAKRLHAIIKEHADWILSTCIQVSLNLSSYDKDIEVCMW